MKNCVSILLAVVGGSLWVSRRKYVMSRTRQTLPGPSCQTGFFIPTISGLADQSSSLVPSNKSNWTDDEEPSVDMSDTFSKHRPFTVFVL